MTKSSIISMFLLILLIGLSASAETVQELGQWKKGELLIENYSFEDDLAAWDLEDGACCIRGGLYTMEIDEKNPQHGNKSLKIVGHKATGTPWHAKVKQYSVSMEKGEKYSVVFWARAEKQREVKVNFQTQHDPWTNHLSGQPNPVIILNGPEWEEYNYTFTATADIVRDMWVSLAIAQSDVDFWIDNFRYFEGEPQDDLNRDTLLPVDAKEKLAMQWSELKSERF